MPLPYSWRKEAALMEEVTEYTEGAGEPERMDTSYEVAEVSALRVENMSEPISENESSG